VKVFPAIVKQPLQYPANVYDARRVFEEITAQPAKTTLFAGGQQSDVR
jgi:hypothetical protein